MKRTATLLLAVVLLLPVAGAQVPSQPAVGLELEGWESPLPPNSANNVTLIIHYDCDRVDPVEGSKATVNVTAPRWATVDGPTSLTLDPDEPRCLVDGRASREVGYNVSIDEEAPALDPRIARLNVTVAFRDGNETGHLRAELAATFVAAMEVGVNRRRAEIRADETAAYNLTVINDSNDWVIVETRIADADDRLNVSTPPSGEVASPRFPADNPAAWHGTVEIRATPPSGAVNATYNATINVTASYRAEPGLADPSVGSTSELVPLTVTVRRPESAVEPSEAVPGGGTAGTLAAAGLAALIWALKRKTL